MSNAHSMKALLVSFSIISSLHCYASKLQVCPVRRSYNIERSDLDGLTVDCHGNPDVEKNQLIQHLDSLLSSNLTHNGLWSLTIVNTPLTHVPRSVCRLTTLTRLNLYHNRLTRLDKACLDNITELRSLKASHNNISELPDHIFDLLTKLEELELNWNRISSIGLRVFSDPDKLTHLRRILLGNNQITSLEPWPYQRGMVGSRTFPVYVSLTGNMISTFTNRLRFNFSCGSRVAYLHVDISDNRIRHVMDAFTAWNRTYANTFCLLRHWQGQPNIKPILAAASFACDCVDFEIIKYNALNPFNKLYSKAYCNRSEVPSMGSNEIPRIPLDQFVCEIKKRCPPGCRCVNRPANATLHVYCSNSNLTALPLEVPELPNRLTKYKLDLSNNRLFRRLEHRGYLANTSVLNVTDCSIEQIPLEVWNDISTMKRASLERNLLGSLPSSVANVPLSGLVLSMDGNPWECSCENRWMSHWLRSVNDSLVNVDALLCGSPSRLRGKNIFEISDKEFCVDPVLAATLRTGAITLSLVGGVVFCLLSLGVITYRLRVGLYTRWKFHPFDRDECLGEDMAYDAFLCCSSYDHEPGAAGILNRLADSNFRVCYHYTDFRPGAPILENVEASIAHSKRTVCLLTENFLRSSMCLFEFEAALHHWISKKRTRRLIVLMALDSPNDLYANDASDTASLRQYLRQYTYIDYTAVDWLDKLLYALPLRGMNQQQGEDNQQLLEMQF